MLSIIWVVIVCNVADDVLCDLVGYEDLHGESSWAVTEEERLVVP